MDLNFNSCKILIVGDVMLDKYYFGKVERISPEAPVPIVNIVTEESRLGGASNVANNITSLGGQATLCGAIGYDFFGKEIERMAHRKGIKTDFVKTEQPTITKARIIGGRQQIVRIDYEQHLELSEKAREDFQIHLASLFQEFPTLVISDYGKGMISEELCSFLIKTAKSHRTRVIVDPKGQNWKKYTGADLITPNVKELGDIIGHPVKNNDQEIAVAALEIVHRYGLSALLVTRSEQGMSLISDQNILHLPTHSQEVFDVSGAGDTVVAALSLALTQGQEITEAMRIANVAAGIVVQKIGTATLSVEVLKTAFLNLRYKVFQECRIICKFRMERCYQHILFFRCNDMPIKLTQHFYPFLHACNIRSTNKHQLDLF